MTSDSDISNPPERTKNWLSTEAYSALAATRPGLRSEPLTRRRADKDDDKSPWVVTIAMESENHRLKHDRITRLWGKNFTPLTMEQRAAVKHATDVLSNAMNVTFQFVDGELGDMADVRISQATPRWGFPGAAATIMAGREIFINNRCSEQLGKNSFAPEEPNNYGMLYVMHELLHVLLGIPDRIAANPAFSTDDTLMAYTYGKNTMFAFRPMDLAAGRHVFGDRHPMRSVASSDARVDGAVDDSVTAAGAIGAIDYRSRVSSLNKPEAADTHRTK